MRIINARVSQWSCGRYFFCWQGDELLLKAANDVDAIEEGKLLLLELMTEDDTYNTLRRQPIQVARQIIECLHRLKAFNRSDFEDKRTWIDKELSPHGWSCDSFEIATNGRITRKEETAQR